MSYRTARRNSRRTSRRAALLSLAALGPLGVAATTARAQDAGARSRQGLTGVVGIGVIALPRYVGSDEYRLLPLPIAQLEYKGRVYLGGSQGSMAPGVGAHVVRTPTLTWDVGLAGAGARPESRGDALAGMGKRSAASFASTGVAYRFGVVAATAGAAVGLGKDEGSYGTVGLGTELPLARRWVGGVSTGATFANARHMAFDFGVTGEQSAARRSLLAAGDPRLSGVDVGAFAPRAGLKETRTAASLSYLLTQRSRVVLFGQSTTLSGQAARSPLVRTRTGVVTGVAVGYGL
jgi:outer membrane scaffolding protein for murein synthesis (MipA/OmpV family)